jgi:ABC-type lipoprotein export system ATPase subunit
MTESNEPEVLGDAEAVTPTADTDAVVAAHDLFVLYRGRSGDVAALRGLSLQVGPRERLVVHGPNGSGKTTLLKVLTGEQRPSAGRAVVAGVDLSAVGEAERAMLRARLLGVVDQHAARVLRPEWCVRDNVALQLRLRGVDRLESTEQAAETLDRFGLGGLGDRSVATLSGGEAQRVGVCAALAHGPRLLLADEPTGELDRASAEQAYDVLAEAASTAGAALVLVTHDPAAARIAERVVRIRDGRLSEQWEPGSGRETLVVDERGWVRLPESVRDAAGAREGVHVEVRDGAVTLAGTGPLRPVVAPRPRIEVIAAGEPVAEARELVAERGGRCVLDSLSATARSGRLTVVHGRSGSGKSTLLRMLAGLDRPDSGEVLVAGTSLAGLDRDGLARVRREHIAYAGQNVYLTESMDVVDSLRAGRLVRGLAPDETLVERWIDALGLGGLRHREVAALSGGERARTAVARALVAGRTLVLLDEPTAQLDEANAESLAAALVGAARSGAAVVVATHDPVVVAAADDAVPIG